MTQTIENTGSSESRIVSTEPITGASIGSVPVMNASEVKAVVDKARVAQKHWARRSFTERAECVLRFRDALTDASDDLTLLLAREAGKPRMEGLVHEVAVTAGIATYFAKNAEELLGTRERPASLLKHRKSLVTYMPRGVVGVIGPWNFPLQLPLRDVLVAVMAGNAAVVKPSEVTPLIMMRAKEIWDESGMPTDLLGIVTGYGATGAALIDSGIDLCVFTGSVRTGKRVAAACGERLIPCIMELGGKAPLLACSDCDIERTANAIVNGGFANSGQVCISVERVYAHRDVYDALIDRVQQLVSQLTPGDPAKESCDIGGITFDEQISVAEAHIADAQTHGARVLVGGKRRSTAKMAFEPTVLVDCDHQCSAMTEEIFGPVVAMMKVDSDDQAIELANQSHLGLNAYVFSEDPVRGRRIAEQIEAGSVLVNEVLINGAMSEAPFGGIKQSGFGRVLGEEGLRAMCHVRHISLPRIDTPKKNPVGFPYTQKGYDLMSKATQLLYSSGSVLTRIGKLFS